jgi:hypothetical protein
MTEHFDIARFMRYRMVMSVHAGFSPRDWELAPQYASPGTRRGGVIVIDFGVLSAMAAAEEEIGSFRPTPDGTLAKAPLHVDDLPAAFYRVNTAYTQFTPNHNTTRRETLVIMSGVLKLALNDRPRDEEGDRSLADTFYAGQVVELEDRPVSMQAVGLVDPASCLALALYRDRDIQIQTVL